MRHDRWFALTAAIAAALAAPSLARADEPLDREQFAPHVNIGSEAMGGGGMATFVARAHVGISKAFGTTRVRPSLGVGVTFGGGVLNVDDPRALSGTLDLGYVDYGPELQVGMRWGNGGLVDNRLFASVAFLRTELDDRLMIDAVEGVGGTRGMRASLGLSWADAAGRLAAEETYDSSRNRTESWNWAILFLPQQIELGWERSAGSDRIGLTLSYGI